MKKNGRYVLLVVLSLFYVTAGTLVYAAVDDWWAGFDWGIINMTGPDPGDSLSFYNADNSYQLVLSDMDLSGRYYTGFDSYRVYDLQTGVLIVEGNYKDGLSTSIYERIVGNQTVAAEVVATESMRASVKQTTSLISTHIGQIFKFKRVSNQPKQSKQPKITNTDKKRERELKLASEKNSVINKLTGLSAGDEPQAFGVWANGSGTVSKDTTESSEFDSTLGMGILGFDYMVTPDIVAGLAIGGEKTRVDTKYNNGRLDTSGFTLSPYFAVLINDYCSFNITGGYSWLNSDQNKLDGAITSSMDSNRWFGSANVYGYYYLGKLNFTGIFSYTYSQEHIDEYTESDSNTIDSLKAKLGTVGLGVELGYQITDLSEIYSGIEYNYDTTFNEVPDISYDRDAFTIGVGFRTVFIDNISLDLNVSTMLGRDNQTETTGMINLRYDF